MVKNNFRAVLTIYDKDKVLELRFNGLNEDRTKLQCIPNTDYRHDINTEKFVLAIKNLVNAMICYDIEIKNRYQLGKMMGLL